MSSWIALDILLMSIGGVWIAIFLGTLVYALSAHLPITLIDPSTSGIGLTFGIVFVVAGVGSFLLGFIPQRHRIIGFLRS